MYVETVPNRGSPPAILLREGWREGGKTHKRALANLSAWPPAKIHALRRLLRNETLVCPADLFRPLHTLPQGHVQAVLAAIRKLGLDSLLASQRCRERDLAVAMTAGRLLHPCSKLAATRYWLTSTLAQELEVEDATGDDPYHALGWLLERQPRIGKKLPQCHLREGALVLHGAGSGYHEGRTCPLAHSGHGRDGRKGLPIIVYGVRSRFRKNPSGMEYMSFAPVRRPGAGRPKTRCAVA
jgi:hypothetical protein